MAEAPENAADFVVVARIARPQGRRGEVAAEILTDFPERLVNVEKVFVRRPGGTAEPAEVEDAWFHKGRIILKLAGVDSIDQAEPLREAEVLIPQTQRAPLGEHQYWVSDLVGCQVLVERGGAMINVGQVAGVDPAGEAELLRVQSARGEILIPLAREICTRIDAKEKVIVINPPEDLLELNQK